MERYQRLFTDARYQYPDSATGRAQAVTDMNAAFERAHPLILSAFVGLTIPTAQVVNMTDAERLAGKAGYREIGKDGAPSRYYVDLSQIKLRPSWTLPSVAFHELVPGHMVQAQYAATSPKDPGFFEGWAVYAEWLMVEVGAYRDDPVAELGATHWRLFRLARIVADEGLQSGALTRAQAAVRMESIQGPRIAFSSIEDDIDRMIAHPGIYARQGRAALRLAAMLKIAKHIFADKFSFAQFHEAVLEHGWWPEDAEKAYFG